MTLRLRTILPGVAAGILWIATSLAPLAPQSTLSLAPTYARALHRDERASPMRYSGNLWGARIDYIAPQWQVAAGGMNGSMSSSITQDDKSVESNANAFVRVAFLQPVSTQWHVGAEVATHVGVRVHTYTTVDAGFGELIVAAGPRLHYTRPLTQGAFRAEATFSILALLTRPYSDARSARGGNFHTTIGLTNEIAAGRTRIAWQGHRTTVFYEISAQRAAGADHYGSLTHSLGAAWNVYRR